MRKVLIAAMLIFSFAAFADESPCEKPQTNVVAKISFSLADEVGNFCYAKNLETSKRYDVIHCGFLKVGDVVIGTVHSYWTHRDEQGNPVCDYQQFVPNL